jgi:carboxymethylenebutenolidase
MTETVEFKSNGAVASGHLVTPDSGSGPGVLVIQEWWGLDPGIKEMARRLGEGGFVALAPDLYHGEVAGHHEMDKAARLMQSLPPDRAARDMSGAVDYLASHRAVTGKGIGVVGFCMGGMLAFIIAANRPDKVKAVVPFYGFPQGDTEPDWSRLMASIRGHMAERDDFFRPEAARALERKLRAMGKDVTLTVHPGTGHAFMGPHNALGTLNEKLAAKIWPQVVSFLHTTLD